MVVHLPVCHARGGGHPEELETTWIPACAPARRSASARRRGNDNMNGFVTIFMKRST